MSNLSTETSTTDFTWHVCPSIECWCSKPNVTVDWRSQSVFHEHDYRQVKGELALFCRTCGETKRISPYGP